MGIRTTSSIGYGSDQCNPDVNKAFCPSPTGLPKRRITAFSCGPTVKKPEQKNATTISTITILTIAKLLPNASASACEPASSAVIRRGMVVIVMMLVVVIVSR